MGGQNEHNVWWRDNSANSITWILLLLAGIFVLAVCPGMMGGGPESSNQTTPTTEQDRKPSTDKTDAWIMAQQFVKNKLKSPGMASFGGFGDDYQKPDRVVSNLGDGKYRVRAWVDAQNSFGATIRTRFVCELEYIGHEDWRCTKLEFTE